METIAAERTTLEQARAQFENGAGYLAACTMGLPTRGTRQALADDLQRWANARASAADYSALVERVRAGYARLVHTGSDRVAIGSQVSVFAGLLAASVPAGAEVLCASGDFSSMVFPFLVQRDRGVRVRQVPFADLAGQLSAATWLVAFSAVQSATGEVADLASISAAASHHHVRTFVDTTQAAGWLPIEAGSFDATVCHSYKWLCAPRGVAFLTVTPALAAEVRPSTAGWYAGLDPWESCYGPQMALARSARRFDVSPAWQAWAGAEPALALFASLDVGQVRDYDLGLANSFRAGLGLEGSNSAIVSWADPEGCDLARLTSAGLVASGRAGRARVAFHLWNDSEDVSRALGALGRR